MVSLLLVSVLSISTNIQIVNASGTIYIRADGSIDPKTAPISSVDNVTYIFTDNIYDEIVVERNYTVIDGDGYTLEGNGTGYGFRLFNNFNVTLKNTHIKGFEHGIERWLGGGHSEFNKILNNTITDCEIGVHIRFFYLGEIVGNTITRNDYGLVLSCGDVTIANNTIAYNNLGIMAYSLWDCLVIGNHIVNNIAGYSERVLMSDSTFYHNNFVNNTYQAEMMGSVFDDGYPSGGNYWSDYNGVDLYGGPYQNETGSDGIGDTPYVGYESADNYPLMTPYLWWNPADVNHDLKVDIFDIVSACQAYLSTPSDPHWNCHCDVADPYGIINIFDIVMICSSYGEEY